MRPVQFDPGEKEKKDPQQNDWQLVTSSEAREHNSCPRCDQYGSAPGKKEKRPAAKRLAVSNVK